MISTGSPINNMLMHSVFAVYDNLEPLEKSFFWFSSCGGGSQDLVIFLSSYGSILKTKKVRNFYKPIIPKININSMSSIESEFFEMYFLDQFYSQSIPINVLKIRSSNDFIYSIENDGTLVSLFGFRMVNGMDKLLFFDYNNPILFQTNFDYYLDPENMYNLDIFIDKKIRTIDNSVFGVGINSIVRPGIYNLYIYD